MEKEIENLFRETFKNVLEEKLILEIIKEGKHAFFNQDDDIMQIGQTIQYIPIVLQGTVKAMRENDNAQELLLYYVSSGETCAMTFTCCMMQNKSEVHAVAEEDSHLIFLPVNSFDEWLAKYATWKSFVMKNVRARFHELLRTIDSIAFMKLDERLWEYLLDKSKTHQSKLLNLSHQQIADELATSRVVISRLLKQLENEKKLLLYRNQIKLLGAL